MMEITRVDGEGVLELKVSGRLDARFAETLRRELDECVRQGAHHIRLHLGGVAYLSSAGISVLVGVFRELTAIRGSFAVTSPSPQVRSVLDLAGLQGLIGADATPPPRPQAAESPGSVVAAGPLRLEVYPLLAGAPLRAEVVGGAGALAADGPVVEAGSVVDLPSDAFAVGLGAFGDDERGCRERVGELLAAGGAAVCAPTDESGAPDYLLSVESLVARARLYSGLVCRGSFSAHLRFEHAGDGDGGELTRLVTAALEVCRADSVGMVMVAETVGLIGVALKRSPALRGPGEPFFAHPGVRRWLSFTPERAFARSLALVVGVAAASERSPLAGVLRPLGSRSVTRGHFHAAALPFRPLAKGRVDLADTVARLFEGGPPLGVLHLVTDDRPIVGGGESAFVRGAMWVGPLADGPEARP
jgi:anti-anti-sigma factor